MCFFGRCFGSTAKGNSDDDDDSEYSDFHEEASSVKESIDVNGFQVLPSQVRKFVNGANFLLVYLTHDHLFRSSVLFLF